MKHDIVTIKFQQCFFICNISQLVLDTVIFTYMIAAIINETYYEATFYQNN